MFFKWLWKKLRDESGQVGAGRRFVSRFAPLGIRRGGAATRGNFLNFEQFIPEQLGESPFEVEEALGPEFEQILADLRAQDVGITPEEQVGLTEIEEAADPAARLAALREETEAILRPEAEAALTARGFGRSPAIAEVIGREVARRTGGIQERAAAARERLGRFRAEIGGARLGRERQRLAGIGALLGLRSRRIQSARDLASRRALGLLNLLKDVRVSQASLERRGARGGGGGRGLPFNISRITGLPVGALGSPFAGGAGGTLAGRIGVARRQLGIAPRFS